MNKWKLSYIIHTAVWVFLCVLALFYKNIALLPVALIFTIAHLSYEILGLLTGATDPLATTQGGSRIPEFAWTIYYLFWLLVSTVWLAWGALRWRQGNRSLVLLALHILLFYVGYITLFVVGSINFKFVL